LKVPVIAVFTKFDQFRRDIRMKVEDQDRDADDPAIVKAEMERVLKDEFLAHLKGSPPVVCLESEDFLPTSIYYTNYCPKECTSMENDVLTLLKQLPILSPETLLHLCS
jgi:hypothetical protein